MSYSANLGGANSGAFLGFRIPESHQELVVAMLKDLRRRSGGDGIRLLDQRTWACHLVDLGDLDTVPIKLALAEFLKAARDLKVMNLSVTGLSGQPSALQPRSVHARLGADIEYLEFLQERVMGIFRPFLGHLGNQQFHGDFEVGRLKALTESGRTDLGRALKMVKVDESDLFTVDSLEILLPEADSMGPSPPNSGGVSSQLTRDSE